MRLWGIAVLAFGAAAAANAGEAPGVFERIVCHADERQPRHSEGDVVQLRDGRLLLAWTEFVGGFADDARAHVAATLSSDGGRTWDEKFVLQPNVGERNVMSVSLLRKRDGELLLFFLKKNGPDDLSVWMRRCLSEPDRWTSPVQVTSLPGYHVMNNDRVVELSDGRLLAPVALTPDISKRYRDQQALCYLSDDSGSTWRPGKGRIGFEDSAAMEPGVVELKDGRVLMIIRTSLGCVYGCHSGDRGDTWSEPVPLTLRMQTREELYPDLRDRTLPCDAPLRAPAAPASIERIPSTGDLLLIWINNPKGAKAGWKERNPLTAAISCDEGKTWERPRNLENRPGGSFGYCSIMFLEDRALLTYYDWQNGNRRGFEGANLKLKSVPVAWFYDR